MKAPAFAYARPRSLAETFDLLERPGAKLLAGGQSLLPALNMRLASPELLVDITGLSLSGSCLSGDRRALRLGALVTHAQLGASEEIRKQLPLLAEAVPCIAHPAIRNRGTLGGSLALADPAAELPAVALALEGMLVLQSREGERRVPASGFFKGLYETELKHCEVLVAVEFPVLQEGERWAFLELARRQGDYAIVGLAAHRGAGGLRLAYFGVGDRPVLALRAAQAETLEAAQAALAEDLHPPADLYHSSAAKLHLARVLLARAWNRLSTPH